MADNLKSNLHTHSKDNTEKHDAAKNQLPKPRPQGRPKSHQKRLTILGCASELFLTQGFTKTSMDEVAKLSQVSKQTVYSHFKNKEALYTAVIECKCAEYQIEDASIYSYNTPLADLLQTIAGRFLKLLADQSVIAMYSVVIGEAKNNPKVAELFYEAGPLHSCELVAELLVKHPQSHLDETHAMTVAHDFFNLLKGDFHMRSMLHLAYSKQDVLNEQYAQSVVLKTLAIIELLKH